MHGVDRYVTQLRNMELVESTSLDQVYCLSWKETASSFKVSLCKHRMPYCDKNTNWFFSLLCFQFLAFNILILLEFTFMQEWCRDPVCFYPMASQFLQPHFLSFPYLFELALSSHTEMYLCLRLILFLFYSFIFFYVTTPTLSFNYYNFMIHLTPRRICSPFSLLFKNFLGCFLILFLSGSFKIK